MLTFSNQHDDKRYCGLECGEVIILSPEDKPWIFRQKNVKSINISISPEREKKLLFFDKKENVEVDHHFIDFFFRDFEGEKEYTSGYFLDESENSVIVDLAIKHQSKVIHKRFLFSETTFYDLGVYYDESEGWNSCEIIKRKDFMLVVVGMLDLWDLVVHHPEKFFVFNFSSRIHFTFRESVSLEKEVSLPIDKREYASFAERVVYTLPEVDEKTLLFLLQKRELFFIPSDTILSGRLFYRLNQLFFSVLLTSSEYFKIVCCDTQSGLVILENFKDTRLRGMNSFLSRIENFKLIRQSKKRTTSMVIDLTHHFRKILISRELIILKKAFSLLRENKYHKFILGNIIL